MSAVLSAPHAVPATASAVFDVSAATEALARALERTAVERDRSGGHAAVERELIRTSGLLALSVPRAHGGPGSDWPTILRVVRRLAQVDSALAHLFGFHHLQVASVVLYGNAGQQQRLLRATLAERWFWGNALNPRDRRLVATPVDGGWRLQGTKSFASGSVGSDRLLISAHLADDGEAPMLIASLPTRSAGIDVHEDWDGFGQRQTDSGTVRFDDVFLPQADVLQPPGTVPTTRQTLRPLVSQLTMTNLFVGIAQGALEAARRYALDGSPGGGATRLRAVDDPLVQRRAGELHLLARPAQVLADEAALRLQQALDRGDALGAVERGEVSLAISEAKVLAHRAAIEIGSELFEITGARSTSSRHGLDRFWRNARVHTLHDPIDQRLCDIGRHALVGALPTPGPYA